MAEGKPFEVWTPVRLAKSFNASASILGWSLRKPQINRLPTKSACFSVRISLAERSVRGRAILASWRKSDSNLFI